MTQAALRTLASGAEQILERPLTQVQIESFSKYLEILTKWQKAQRLVGSAEPGWIVENLFLDSLLFLKVLPMATQSLVDIGSGAGIPGLPIKIVEPSLAVTLVESRQRRVSFLRAVVRELGLGGVEVIGERLENLVDRLRGRFDVATMRCSGDPASIVPVALEIVKPGGTVVAAGSPDPATGAKASRVDVPDPVRGRTRRFLAWQRGLV